MGIFSKYCLPITLVLASIGSTYGGSRVSISGAMEPAFYSTGDYKGYLKSLSTEYWLNQYFGASGSVGYFEFLQDRISWYSSVQVNVMGLEALIQSKEWYRQRLQFGLGISRQHKRADETFLEIATRDSTVIQKFLSGYMNTAPDDSLGDLGKFRMRTAIRDENGFYRAGISEVRDYTLYGMSAHLTYGFRLFGGVWALLSPKVKYYRSEPLYIWSVGCGLSISLLPE